MDGFNLLYDIHTTAKEYVSLWEKTHPPPPSAAHAAALFHKSQHMITPRHNINEAV